MMGALVIKTDKKNIRLMLKLADELGAETLLINDEQFDGLTLGKRIEEVKSGSNVDKDKILMKLRRASGLKQV